MESLAAPLRQDYERLCTKIGADNFGSEKTIGYQKVLRAHYLLADYFTGEGDTVLFGVKSEHLLLSAMGRQTVEFEGRVKWRDGLDLCATLFFGLIKNHAFQDGNKRTAFLILLNHLLKVGRTPASSQKEFEDLAVATAANDLGQYVQFKKFKNRVDDPEVRFIADFLRRKTRGTDKRNYIITFRQLDRILRKHGVSFDQPNDNHINVLRDVETKSFFGLKTRRETIRIAQVGFPGWKKQVSPAALKTIRQAGKLSHEHGVDSQVFFRDAEALDALIGIYHGPLQRLKDK